MKRIFSILSILSITVILHAQPVLQSTLEKDTMLIGEQQVFTIAIFSDNSLHSIVPDMQKFENSGLEILSAKSDSIFQEEKHIYYHSFLLTVFDSGSYSIPSIPILVNDYHRVDTLYSEEFYLIVYSPEVDTTTDIKDIKNPVKTPFKFSEILPYVPYIAGLLIVAVLIIILIRYFKKRRSPEKEKEKIPAHITALINLDSIKEKKLWQQGKVKDYYVELSDTVRAYIEDRYGISAMESVTYEILENFKQYSYDDEILMEMLESLLNLSDLVKFAKEKPDPSENEVHLSQAYIFVEKTKVVDLSKPLEITDEEVKDSIETDKNDPE